MCSLTLTITIICIVITANAKLFAQDSENVEQIGRIYNVWDDARDVVIQGDYAYVATGRTGLQIADISNPRDPQVVGYWDDNLDYNTCIAIDGNLAFLIDYGGLYIIDISNPNNPELLSHYDEIRGSSILVTRDVAFVARGDVLTIMDVCNPEDIAELSQIELPSWIRSFKLSGDIVYVLDDSGLRLYNVSDPAELTELGFIRILGYTRGIYYADNVLYYVTMDPSDHGSKKTKRKALCDRRFRC